MALIVQKYGGTSVADPDRIKSVADHVAYTKKHGNDVIVVVSAMGKTTDNLLSLAHQVSDTHPGREMDMLLTTGERISMALVSMALAGLGIEAVSFTGSQVGIITDTVHTKAKILDMVRPSSALYIGGMGARGKNFYNDICSAYGYEAEAKLVQDLYLDGKKDEAASKLPGEWIMNANLVGTPGFIKERVAAFKEAGVTVLSVNPIGPDPVGQIEKLRAIIDG